MATAPQPGKGVRKRSKRQGFRVKLYGVVYELQLRDIGPSDEGLVRQTTGKPFSAYINDYGIDSLAVIVWLSRRKSGEKKLTLAKVFETFPSSWEFNDSDEHDFDVLEDVEEGDDDDAVIDVDGSEADKHPLPPAAS